MTVGRFIHADNKAVNTPARGKLLKCISFLRFTKWFVYICISKLHSCSDLSTTTIKTNDILLVNILLFYNCFQLQISKLWEHCSDRVYHSETEFTRVVGKPLSEWNPRLWISSQLKILDYCKNDIMWNSHLWQLNM